MLKQLIFVVFLAFVCYQTSNYVDWLRIYQRTYNHKPGTCRRLDGIEHGSEDIQLLPSGLAFISSGVIVRDSGAYRGRVGKIFLFDFNNPDTPPQQLHVVKDGTDLPLISPLALGVWIDEQNDKTYLYVAHYIKNAMDVNKFLFIPATRTLQHVRHIPQQPAAVHMLDNFVVVGEDKFFYTNWVYSIDVLEMLLGIHWGSIGFFDGKKAKLIQTGLFTPNGIGVSPDGKFLYVALSSPGEIYVYHRKEDNSISFNNSIKVWTTPDNLIVDPRTGDIWLGAHPVLYKTLRYMDDPTYIAPSQVLRVKMTDGKATAIDEIYSDDGTQISASSVAVVHDNGLLIGSMAGHAVYCTNH